MNKSNPMRQIVFPLLAALIWGTAFVAQDMWNGWNYRQICEYLCSLA